MLKILGFACAMISLPALAQHTEGVLTYTQKTDLRGRMKSADPAIQVRMPESVTANYQLAFTSTEALYEASVEAEEGGGFGGPGGGMMRFRGNQGQIYTDLANKQRTETRDLFGEKYRINSEMKRIPWKLGTETKTIKGMLCQKATFADSVRMGPAIAMAPGGSPPPADAKPRTQTIVAWYCPEIPLPLGPQNFGGLPGLIMEVDINNGEMLTTVSEIEWRKPKGSEIKAPKGGKVVTEQEFRSLMMEKMKDMPRGNGNVIRIGN